MAWARTAWRHRDLPLVVALLATVLTAITTGLASAAASEADGSRQQAFRLEVRRTAAGTTGMHYTYLAEGLRLYGLEALDIRAEEFRRAAEAAGTAAGRLRAEAELDERVAVRLREEVARRVQANPGLPIVTAEQADGLRDAEGAIDLGRVFVADQAALGPPPAAPDMAQEDADHAVRRGRRFAGATYGGVAALLLGWLASAAPRVARPALAATASAVLVVSGLVAMWAGIA